MKNKIVSFLLASSMVIILVACGNGSGDTPANSHSVSSVSDSSAMESSSTSFQPPAEVDPILKDISVEMKIDEVLSQAIVTVSNNSTKTFSGNVFVRFYDLNKKRVGSDMLMVEELPAGNSTYARLSIDAVYNITMEYEIPSPVFSEGAVNAGGTLNEASSKSLAEEFELSFGGAGNPEWATSWYGYVTAIEVHEAAGGNYALITVKDGTPQDAVDRIGNCIFANYSPDYSLGSVRIITSDGSTVFTRSAS